ncbi:MAG: DUF1353 domain-containing protein [Thermosphaera sp.]
MGRFYTKLRIELIGENGRPRWRLVESLEYFSYAIEALIEVPQGFETDLASVPRIPLAWLIAGGKANAAAVVHDWLYHGNPMHITRKQADDVFYEAMTDSGISWWRRNLMYIAVRLFAGPLWEEGSSEPT